jgi:hypothetical protein
MSESQDTNPDQIGEMLNGITYANIFYDHNIILPEQALSQNPDL